MQQLEQQRFFPSVLFNENGGGGESSLISFREKRRDEGDCFSALIGYDWWDDCWLDLQQLQRGTSFPPGVPLMLCSKILSIKTSKLVEGWRRRLEKSVSLQRMLPLNEDETVQCLFLTKHCKCVVTKTFSCLHHREAKLCDSALTHSY